MDVLRKPIALLFCANRPDRPNQNASRTWPAFVVILIVLSAAQSASAVYIRHDRSVYEHNKIGGSLSFGSSGYIADSRDAFQFASGTLISPTKVLTAAHVVDGDGDLRIDDLGQLQRLTF